MKFHATLLLTALVGSALSPFAHGAPDTEATTETPTKMAKPQKASPAVFFKTADGDLNGQLSLAEIQSKRAGFTEARFKTLDKNSDGALDLKEFSTPEQPDPKKLHARLDLDHDGKLSAEEFTKRFTKTSPERFAKLDKNSDGFLQPNEMPVPPPKKAAEEKKPVKAKKATSKATSPDYAVYLTQLIALCDGDDSKSVTLSEIHTKKPGFPEPTFASLDRDKNGVLSEEDSTPPAAK